MTITHHCIDVDEQSLHIQFEDGGQLVVPVSEAEKYGITNPLVEVGEFKEV